MAFDRPPLGVVERAGLSEDVGRDAEHAGVMEQRRQHQLQRTVAQLGIIPHNTGHHLGHDQAVAGDEPGGLLGAGVQKAQRGGLLCFGEDRLRQGNERLDLLALPRIESLEQLCQFMYTGHFPAALI